MPSFSYARPTWLATSVLPSSSCNVKWSFSPAINVNGSPSRRAGRSNWNISNASPPQAKLFIPSNGDETAPAVSGLNRRAINSPTTGKRLGSTIISSLRLSTALPIIARDRISSISVVDGDSLPSMLLTSEKPSISFFLASTCTIAFAW
ncbi:hypothetical protein D3C76_1365520 [compost metagenome]